MYKFICILKCLTLVATNPLQGLQSCPQVQYDGPLITTANYKPHQQQVVLQNQISPALQTIPYLHDEQISRLYYKVQPTPINAFADVNTRAYDANGIEIARYVVNPAGNTPNVVNNYIIVPPEYFKLNQSVPNDKLYYQKKCSKDDTDVKSHDNAEIVKRKKTKRHEHVETHANIDNYNNDKQASDKQSNDVPKKKAKRKGNSKNNNKSKRKSSKKNKNKDEGLEPPKVIDEGDVVLKPDKQRAQPSKLKVSENENYKELEHRESKTKKSKTDDDSKIAKKNKKKNKKVKSSQVKSTDSQPQVDQRDDIHINNSPKEITKKTADVDVCFDINEECCDLECRKTRNNCHDHKYNNNHHHHHHNNNQQNMQRDCPANIASYLNSFMSMPQLNTNYFNPMGNFPYNFNYLYQMPPQSSTRSNESNKKRKKGKKKQKPNDSNTHEKQGANQNQDEEVTSDDCEKVVELTPMFVEIEQTNEPIISKVISQHIEENEDKTVKDFETKEFDNHKRVIEPIENNKPKLIEPLIEIIDLPAEIIEPVPEIIKPPPEIIKPSNINIIDDSEDDATPGLGKNENFYVAPVLDEEVIPFLNYNDVIDEYYPDFTSDNIYLSKEDYESNNFHDRYYYFPDNKAEMSREKRRYEHARGKSNRKSNDVHNNKQKVNNIKDKKSNRKHKDKENSSEVKFRVPPPLEFPDFKTEMVTWDRDGPRIQGEREDNEHKNEISKNVDHDNVETVSAHSKVVKYGASPDTKDTSFDLTPADNDDEKILLSRDGDTTLVIARSLGYPDDY